MVRMRNQKCAAEFRALIVFMKKTLKKKQIFVNANFGREFFNAQKFWTRISDSVRKDL